MINTNEAEIFDYFKYENSARMNNFNQVAGGDEAGRGPWAGPVSAAFVMLPNDFQIGTLNDSKKLSRKKRIFLFERIKSEAICYGIGYAEASEIDNINILEATRLAFKRAFTAMKIKPDYVLLDFIKLPWLTLPHQAFAKGESISASIAAASILAKENRDILMEDMAKKYPGYSFEKHMGYGTKAHMEALEKLGPCEIHRKSFKPIKKYLTLAD